MKIEKENIEKIIKECYSIADVCRCLNIKPSGSNYKTIHHYINVYNLDVKHFTGKRVNIGNKLNKKYEKDVYYYLTQDSYIQTTTLKWKLISSGLKKYKCEECGLSKWNGKQIVLQLHHINGDTSDNRLENLKLICPNCHSQTDTFTGKNIKTKNKNEKTYYCRLCHNIIEKNSLCLCDKCYDKMITGDFDLTNIDIQEKTTGGHKTKKCIDCGKAIDKHATRCQECAHIYERKQQWPDKETLNKLILEKPFTQIAKIYSVCDNTIRKWCKYYGLPYKKKDIKIMQS